MADTSSSSSSSEFCRFPDCFGDDCSNFDAWNFSGIHSGSTIEDKLYVVFVVVSGLQQVVSPQTISKDILYFINLLLPIQ